MRPDHERRAAEVLERLRVSNPVGAEIGVFVGQMSHTLLEWRRDLFLYMIDPWASEADNPQRYKDSNDYHSRMSQVAQDSYHRAAIHVTEFAAERRKVIRAFSNRAVSQFDDKSLDFVFIDGDHSYEGCLEDIEIWLPKLKSGALLCGDDYDNTTCNPLFGVDRAVNESVAKYNWSLDLGDCFTWFVRPL